MAETPTVDEQKLELLRRIADQNDKILAELRNIHGLIARRFTTVTNVISGRVANPSPSVFTRVPVRPPVGFVDPDTHHGDFPPWAGTVKPVRDGTGYPAILRRGDDGRITVSFPDLPEALTDGVDEVDALREAADCLSEALASRIADGEEIPPPSQLVPGQHVVRPEGLRTPYRTDPHPLFNPAAAALFGYHDPACPERDCDHCHKPYRGPAVYCSLACALADA